jgi:hypothetical protein
MSAAAEGRREARLAARLSSADVQASRIAGLDKEGE